MASAFDTMFGDSAVPALQVWHGESFVRWPKGHSGSSVTVAGCMWTPEETAQRDADQDGEQYVLTGVLQVPESASPIVGDVWIIGGEQYAAQSVSDVHATLHYVTLKHVNKQQTSRHRDGFY
jgi:hypothetical protein